MNRAWFQISSYLGVVGGKRNEVMLCTIKENKKCILKMNKMAQGNFVKNTHRFISRIRDRHIR